MSHCALPFLDGSLLKFAAEILFYGEEMRQIPGVYSLPSMCYPQLGGIPPGTEHLPWM